MSLEKPLYKKVYKPSKGFGIQRPDGSIVNGWHWKDEVMCDRYLELLEAYNVCRRE